MTRVEIRSLNDLILWQKLSGYSRALFKHRQGKEVRRLGVSRDSTVMIWLEGSAAA